MRNIVWSAEFEEQVARAGGAEVVDDALAPIVDALMRDPYGFEKFENDFTSFRYAKTEPMIGKLGALTIIFTIDRNKDVVLQWFEEDPPFQE